MSPGVGLMLVWHFHQPYYSAPGRRANALPWVRLHAIKGYYDMARALEEHPGVRCTVNFSGSLLKQLAELEDGRRDVWWELTRRPARQLTRRDKELLLRHFFSIDPERGITPWPRYAELRAMKEGLGEGAVDRFAPGDWRDLQVWFNLAWCGAHARRERPIIRALLEKGRGFTESEKEALLEQHVEIVQLISPMYRRLHRRGQVEISISPMYHPILPLLIDTESAMRATPERPQPPRMQAWEDAREHIERSVALAREVLGIEPIGLWPSEGAISPEVVQLADELGFAWTATDAALLPEARGDAYTPADAMRPWRLEGLAPAVFFRDAELSTDIESRHAGLEAEEAADAVMASLGALAQKWEGAKGSPLVSLILDGENPWERYLDDGAPFLDALYRRLEDSEHILTTTPGDWLDGLVDAAGLEELTHMPSGSWHHGNYQIWIGHEQTNRAWSHLLEARSAMMTRLEEVEPERAALAHARDALYMAQGSDWFWWYGDDFSSMQDADFDRIFREQLREVYQGVGLVAPATLDLPIASGLPFAVPFEPPSARVHPRIDGTSRDFYAWSGAGIYFADEIDTTQIVTSRRVERILLGFGWEDLFGRIEFGPDMSRHRMHASYHFSIAVDELRYQFDVFPHEGGAGILSLIDDVAWGEVPVERVAVGEVVEFAIPFEFLGLEDGSLMSLSVTLKSSLEELERHPPSGAIKVAMPDSFGW